jgi:plastocyanin
VPQLVGTVGPGFTIDLTDAAGKHVDAVPAGRYEVLIHDLSDMHNFVLGEKATGARPAQTEVAFVGDATFTVDLRPGLWVYACSPHFETMNGKLMVVAAPATPAAAQTVSAVVTDARASVSKQHLSPGSVRITVADRSAKAGFRLLGPGIDRRTGRTFKGTVTWTVQLGAGRYRFGGAKLSGTLTVS